VRLHGLASSPTPETQVRLACECANDASRKAKAKVVSAFTTQRFIMLILSSLDYWVEHPRGLNIWVEHL